MAGASSGIRIGDFRVEDSPRQPHFVRISAEAQFPDFMSRPERLWFEVPEDLADSLEPSGDAWLVTLLPLAVTQHWAIAMDKPIDAELLTHAGQLMRIWHTWYPALPPVAINADARAPSALRSPSKKGLFFSGGVDSTYTLFHTIQSGEALIDDLIMIHGFDISVANDAGFERASVHAKRIAATTGRRFVPIATNARQTRFREADWGGLAFGCLLAGAGLALGRRYKKLLISSGLLPGGLRPHGSHPLTDPLYSTESTHFIHYAYDVARNDKLEFLRRFPAAWQDLRVCFGSESGDNCGRCRKCLAVMAFLDIHGELATCSAFPGGALDLENLRRVYLSGGFNTYRSLQTLAEEHGRFDIRDAIEHAFRRTEALDRWLGLRFVRQVRARAISLPFLRRMTHWLRPLVWRLGQALNWRLPR